MGITDPSQSAPKFVENAGLVQQMDEIFGGLRVEYDATATAEMVQRMMLDFGTRPEGRIFTKELLSDPL